MIQMLFRRQNAIAASLLAVSAALCACGDDETTTTTTTTSSTTTTTSSTSGSGGGGTGGEGVGGGGGSGGGSAAVGDIEVTVEYKGMTMVTANDSLNVAAFVKGEPMGLPPAFFTKKDPMFPVTDMLKALEPGTYDIYAILDIGSNNQSAPGPEDLVGTSMMAVEVKGNDAPKITVTIMDKP